MATAGDDDDAGHDAAPIDARPPDLSDAGSIACLGGTRTAYLCDGFEGALSSEWTKDTTEDGTFEPTTREQLSGSTQSAVSDIPGTAGSGNTVSARVRWHRPDGGRRLAIRVWVYLEPDAWDKEVSFASVFDGQKEGKLVFSPKDNTANGSLSFRVGTESIDLGSIVEKTWTCLEIAADGTQTRAFAGSSQPKGAIADLTGITDVALGMMTDARGKDFYYDNVIIAPDPIGCAVQ
jgi:hypothetical protein